MTIEVSVLEDISFDDSLAILHKYCRSFDNILAGLRVQHAKVDWSCFATYMVEGGLSSEVSDELSILICESFYEEALPLGVDWRLWLVYNIAVRNPIEFFACLGYADKEELLEDLLSGYLSLDTLLEGTAM